MSKISITINGVAYPCRQTMGAMLRFKQETGKEVTEIDAGSLTDLCTFLWCCIVSACKADGVAFDMPLMDFADSITPEEALKWADANKEQPGVAAEGERASAEKKS